MPRVCPPLSQPLPWRRRRAAPHLHASVAVHRADIPIERHNANPCVEGCMHDVVCHQSDRDVETANYTRGQFGAVQRSSFHKPNCCIRQTLCVKLEAAYRFVNVLKPLYRRGWGRTTLEKYFVVHVELSYPFMTICSSLIFGLQ